MWNINGKKYDLYNFLDKHPGGKIILESCKNGVDSTAAFNSYHAMCDTHKIENIMQKYEVNEELPSPKLFMFNKNDFYDVVRTRVKKYFVDNNLSHHCNTKWICKSIAQIILYIVPFIMACYFKGLGLFLRMFLAFFSGHMFIQYGFGVMHDASHCAVSYNPRVNEYLSSIWNSLALWDAQLWNKHHCYWHHSFTGTTKDPDTLHFLPIIRKSFQEKKYKYFDISYCPGLIILFVAFIFPGFWFGQVLAYLGWIVRGNLWRISLGIYHHHYIESLIKLFVTFSLIYSGNFCVLYSYVLACNITYFLCIMPNHDTLETHLNVVYNTKNTDWGKLQVLNSGNFATHCDFVNDCFGGINFQIEHHLFPTISHVHFPQIQSIVKQTCKEFDIPYNEQKNVYSALLSAIKNFTIISKTK
jgi:linoleoyl-CoA desaturase